MADQKKNGKAERLKKREETKTQELNEYKNRIYDMVETYHRKEVNPGHHGPLRYFQGLFTASVAVASKSTKRYESFKHFLDQNILLVDEEVLSYFDCEKNMTAFQTREGQFLKGVSYDESFGYPQFLLLEKARMEKDKALVEYLKLKDFSASEDNAEMNEAEKNAADKAAWDKKDDTYLKWLHGVAFFEICVRKLFKEYRGEFYQLKSEMGKEASEESFLAELTELTERIKNFDFEIYKQMDSHQQEQWNQETIELYETYNKKYSKLCYRFSFFYYLWILLHELFASCRIILLVEYVDVNAAERPGTEDPTGQEKSLLRDKKYRLANTEALFWKHEVEKLLNEGDEEGFSRQLFMEMLKWDRNYSSRYKELIDKAWIIYPPRSSTSSDEMNEQAKWFNALKEYISILEKKYGSNNTGKEKQSQKQEKTSKGKASEANDLKNRMLELQMQLADPIWKVMDKEIFK